MANTTRYGGHQVPIIEKKREWQPHWYDRPVTWDRSTGRHDYNIWVAQPHHVKREVEDGKLRLMLRHGAISGGDYVPYVVCPRVEIAAGSTVAGTAAGFIPGTNSVAFAGSGSSTLGSGGFWYPQRSLRITLWGVMTTASASPGTFTPDWKVDTTAGGTTGNSLGVGPASATLATGITNGSWRWDSYITCRSIGTSGTLYGHGNWIPNTTLFTTQVELFLPNTAPTTATVDTTQNSFIKFIATLGSASDNMNIDMGFWETLN